MLAPSMSLHDLLAQLRDFAGHSVPVAKMCLQALAAVPHPFVLTIQWLLAKGCLRDTRPSFTRERTSQERLAAVASQTW